MTEQTVVLDHRVAEFAAGVRARLGDLSAEEREELAGDLEVDLAELVAERGPEALGDPAAYAAELRSAAGFAPVASTATRAPLGLRVCELLDAAHARWDALVGGLPGRPWELLVALRPVWWVFRAWLALSLVDLVWGRGGYGLGLSVVPSVGLASWPLLVLAVVVSVLIGLRRAWPGRGGVGARVVLLALNTFAVVVATPICLAGYTSAADVQGWYGDGESVATEGLTLDGRPIHNLYAYDAQGQPLTGVQLLDQDGEPVDVPLEYWDESDGADVELTPWRAGLQDVRNVFPLPERRTDNMTGEWQGDPALAEPPVAALPGVALEGVTPSRVLTPAELTVLQQARERAQREARQQARREARQEARDQG